MKIIEPSAHIEELPDNIYQRIRHAATVCYQVESNHTVEEAKKFCQKMIDSKHGMALEFATVHLVTKGMAQPESRFIQVVPIEEFRDYFLVSGSIRAFREAVGEYGSRIWNFLAEEYPLFFTESDPSKGDVHFARPHEIPWQHEHVAVRVVCSRAISHQLVTHRPVARLMESQRYCRYDGDRFDGEVTFIRPQWTGKNDSMMSLFILDCKDSEDGYFYRLKSGLSPQEARGVLTNDAKTELLIYANLPEWQHILNEETMRCSPHADPEMQRIMKPLREEFKGRWPEVF